MTLPLDQFQRCFDRAQDVNVKAAQMAGAMAEMGRYAKEMTVYGSVLWRDGQRFYAVSNTAEKVHDYLIADEQIECLAVPVISQTISLWVPSGYEETVGRTVRRALAKQMAKDYPAVFFESVEPLANFAVNNSAEEILDEMQTLLEGVFDQEQLKLFEGLLYLAYKRGNVTPLAWQRYKTWLTRQHQEMAGDAVQNERFQQTFHGFAFQKADKNWDYYANAVKGTAYQRLSMLKAQGYLTTTLVSKRCGYATSQPPKVVRADFLEHLRHVFEPNYLRRLLQIAALPPAADQAAFDESLSALGDRQLEPCLQVLKQWGRDWGLRV